MNNHSPVLFGWILLGLGFAMGACVEHRPERNGLRNESVYLEKAALTAANPKTRGQDDRGWLYKVTVVKASAPNVVADYAFPGLESSVRYVRFRFAEDALQMIDGRSLQQDDLDDPNDDLATVADRVTMEFPGTHVDVKFRENLDGERTNWLEENFEEDWQKRQKFKVDFEDAVLDPVAHIAWYYGDYIQDCARQVSVNMVPGSFEFDEQDQYMSWVLEASYVLNVATLFGPCYDMLSLSHDTGTATIQYRFSFYRPGPSDYEPETVAEKDLVNKKYGAFQLLNLFRDEDTGILSAHSLLQRWNPHREEPVVFYFHEGFPQKFKPLFQNIETETNRVLSEAGAKLRFRFLDHDHDGKVRQFGDIRYSFVTWHQGIDTTRGLLGYGPSSADPRTGEVLSANLNLYNIGMDYYRYLIQTYLEDMGGRERAAVAEAAGLPPETPWEEVACTEGETTAPARAASSRLQTVLFDEMLRVMDKDENATYTESDFIPTPERGAAFYDDYHRLLPEMRYIDPMWNNYVWQTTFSSPLGRFAERMATEREFQETMFDVMMGQNPFGATGLYSREGIEAQQDFIESMRVWRRNHAELQAAEETLFGLKNIYLFDAADAFNSIAKSARRCASGTWESDADYSSRIIEDVVAHTAIHEFGHNIALRHNFYGSVDKKHMRENEVTSSVMDYVASWEDAGTERGWGAYDEAALKWVYGTAEVREQMMAADFLYCTDEHRTRSPLCRAHDLGVTPSQITLNSIERYDWLYKLRNQRAYRTFWDTSSYVGRVYSDIFSPLRMWYMAIFDWGGGGVQDVLMRLDQVSGDRPVLSSQEYDEIAKDFYNDAIASVGMTMAFYDAIINQSASFRNYQTEFDPFYGDVLRLGIIADKLFATVAFMDLQDVYNYDPNTQTYVSLYDAPFGTQNGAIAQRVLDDMLGSNYDTFPWFRYYALSIFASVTNTNLVGSIDLKERIAIERYDTRARD